MLARFAASGGTTTQYKDIIVVDAGTSVSTDNVVFSSTLEENDVIILFIGTSSGNFNMPAGYTLGGNGVISTTYLYSWYYKIVGATPDTSLDIGSTDPDGNAFTYYVLRNVDTSSPIMTSAVASGTDDPPAINITKKTLALAVAFGGNGASALYSAPPSGYFGFKTADSTASNDTFTASAVKRVLAGTEDPGAFTRSGTFTGRITLTIAVNPIEGTAQSETLPSFISASSAGTIFANIFVPAPAGIQDGDLLVAIGALQSGSRLTEVSTGFKLLTTQVSTTAEPGYLFLAAKVASGESGTYAFSQSVSGADARVVILVYRNANKINYTGTVARGTAGTISAPEIFPSYRGTSVAAFFLDNTSGSITSAPAGMTQVFNKLDAAECAVVYEGLQDAVPAPARSITWNNTTAGKSCIQFQISNEPDLEPELIGATHSQYSASGTSLVIDKPYETLQGDLLVAICTQSGGTATWTGPAGWTEVADYNGRPVGAFFYKIAGVSEVGPYTFTSNSSRILSGTILCYRYAAFSEVGTAAGNANPLLLSSILSGYSQSKIIAIAARDAVSITIPPDQNMRKIVTNDDATGQSYVICDNGVSAGTSGTRRFSVGSASNVNGAMLIVKPSGVSKAEVPPLTPLSYITATVATAPVLTSTVLVPYNVQAGDLLVWSEYARDPTGSVPTGFTELVSSDAPAGSKHKTAYKIATGAEAGTVITGQTAAAGTPVAVLIVFRGSTPFASATTGTWNSQALDDGDPAPQTVTPPGSGLVLVLGAAGCRGAVADIQFTTQTPAFDRVISHLSPSGGFAISVGYKIYTTGGSTHTIDVGDAGVRNSLHSGYLQLTT